MAGKKNMGKKPEEWLRQAAYDLETADAMFKARRYIYAVFMCHLAVEKALKSAYQQREDAIPPKSHNLIYFVEKLELALPNHLLDFVATLNSVSVPTRYPDNLDRILKEFQQKDVQKLLERGKELLAWIKTELLKP